MDKSDLEDKIGKFKKRNRVHFKDWFLMIFTALLFDSIQALFSFIFSFLIPIPVIGVAAGAFSWVISTLISIFAWLTFYIWTSIKGWGLSDTIKKIIVDGFIPSMEAIYPLNLLPIWTVKVIIQLSFLKTEDAIYNASGGKADVEKLIGVYKKAV